MLGYLWAAARGYRLKPWCSLYLRWRMETYSGMPAEEIGFRDFWSYLWLHRQEMFRFLAWVERMR
jgi:hypothetical protein